jgi:hypothetical protein
VEVCVEVWSGGGCGGVCSSSVRCGVFVWGGGGCGAVVWRCGEERCVCVVCSEESG